MKVISKGVGKGKTTQLIKMSAKSGSYIVCYSHKEADRIHRVSREMNLSIPLPITYDEVCRKQYSARGVGGLLIDNVEMFIQYTIGNTFIEAMTITPSNK